jgi:hypothetical protein
MYDRISEATRLFEVRVHRANMFYERAIRRAHNEYYDVLSSVVSPACGNAEEPEVAAEEVVAPPPAPPPPPPPAPPPELTEDQKIEEAIDVIFGGRGEDGG